MRNKLYIMGLVDDTGALTPIEYFLSNKQASRYKEMLWQLEDTAGVERSDYVIRPEILNVTAEEAMNRLVGEVVFDENDDYA